MKALTVGEAPEPHLAPDEVLIEVHAASVSYIDYLMICGGYQMRPSLPYVPGTDAAGVVIACGENVNRFRPGDRVTCENWFGGFAERMTAKASRTARLPANTDFVVACCRYVGKGAAAAKVWVEGIAVPDDERTNTGFESGFVGDRTHFGRTKRGHGPDDGGALVGAAYLVSFTKYLPTVSAPVKSTIRTTACAARYWS